MGVFDFFMLEVFIGGLLSGVMYSLVAIGFVLVYKSSGVFNFAQGTMLLFAALTFVSMTERQVNFWVAFAITLMVMVVMGVIIERTVMRPLANQDLLSLFMATVGLNYFLEGLAHALDGAHSGGALIDRSDGTLLGINWYVKGIDDKIPQ